jgi:hypothetical protein
LTEQEDKDYQRIKSLTLKIIEERRPETIRQLINLIKKEIEISEEKLFLIIQELEDEKKLHFDELIFPETVGEYVFSFRAAWYWIILFLSILTVFFTFTIPENLMPQIYARNVLGIIFVLYFPGFTLIKALYPLSVPFEMPSIILDTIERIALSIGLSLAVTPIVGFILYYTPWGLNLAAITLSLLAVTCVLATCAILREYKARKSFFLRKIITVSEYELSNGIINFFVIKGFLKNRRVLIKQIPIDQISNIESNGNELSITWNAVITLFFIANGSQSLRELSKKIRSMQ